MKVLFDFGSSSLVRNFVEPLELIQPAVPVVEAPEEVLQLLCDAGDIVGGKLSTVALFELVVALDSILIVLDHFQHSVLGLVTELVVALLPLPYVDRGQEAGGDDNRRRLGAEIDALQRHFGQ